MKKYLLPILITLCLVFIFYNSLKSAEQSIKESSRVVEIIEKVVDAVYKGNPPEKVVSFLETASRNVLRNYAHSLEFFTLGILAMLYSTIFKTSISKRFITTILFCVLIAVIDEAIQIFSPGRAFEYSDLIRDGIGSIIGSLLILLLWKIQKKYKQPKKTQ